MVPPSADPERDLRNSCWLHSRSLMDGVNPDVLDLPDCAILICKKHWEEALTVENLLEESEAKLRKARAELRKVRKENKELKGANLNRADD